MKEQTGETYTSSGYAKDLFASEAKVGKSCFLIASMLGVLPWQKSGGLVDRPENLHVITFDSNALGGVKDFLIKTCGAKAEALKFNVYNMQQDLLDTAGSESGYDYSFYNKLIETLDRVTQRVRGVPALHVSSLTGAAEGLLRGIQSPVGEQKGTGMDIAKWSDFARQVSSIRNLVHAGPWHSVWEAHILKMVRKGQSKEDQVTTESIQIPGQSGVNFPYNVEHVFRIRRSFGKRFQNTNCDEVYLDTKPTYEFTNNGRGFNENLEAKEPDMVSVFKRLGMKVGHWGMKSAPPKPVVQKPATAR
jgi:hypothetical protein